MRYVPGAKSNASESKGVKFCLLVLFAAPLTAISILATVPCVAILTNPLVSGKSAKQTVEPFARLKTLEVSALTRLMPVARPSQLIVLRSVAVSAAPEKCSDPKAYMLELNKRKENRNKTEKMDFWLPTDCKNLLQF